MRQKNDEEMVIDYFPNHGRRRKENIDFNKVSGTKS